MKINLSISIHILLFFNCVAFSQTFFSSDLSCGVHSIHAGIGKHSLFFANYEFDLKENRYFETTLNAGLGGAPGDVEGGLPSLFNISCGLSEHIGFRPFFLSLGILPMLNFYDHVSYTDLNGTIGIRFEIPKCESPWIFEAGFATRLYQTHVNEVYFPIYFSFGIVI